MIEKPMDVLQLHPVRKGKKRKSAFRADVISYLQGLGYKTREEKGSMGSVNVIAGDPAGAKYLVTAHYDTCARLPFPNFITPCNFGAYLVYQILMVLAFVIVSITAGVAVGLITGSWDLGTVIALAVYWGILIMMMVGPANKHNANDNTSGVVSVLKIAERIPQEHRDKVCFVLFDLEEAGLIGSGAYRKLHKAETDRQIILNLDCVGDGDDIVLFPSKKLKKDPGKMEQLRSVCLQGEKKSLSLHEKGFSHYPSDQAKFPYGVGIAALRRSKLVGLYCSRIHTNRDRILEEENTDLIVKQLLILIAGKESL